MSLPNNMTNFDNRELPFVNGFALQEYLVAEEGIIQAGKNHCSHWYIDGSLPGESPKYWSNKRIDTLQTAIDEYDVQPIYHGNYKVPLASDVPELRKVAIEYTKNEIDLAAMLDAPLIVHAGVVVEPRLVTKTKTLALKNYVNSLLCLNEYAIKKGVTLLLENLSNYKNYRPFHYIFTEMEEFDYVLSEIKDAKFFLDIGHANIGDGAPDEAIRRFHKNIVGMSFSNNDGCRDQHLELGKGTINYKKIVNAILECHWKGIVGFETRGRQVLKSIDDLTEIYESVRGIQ